MKRLIAALHESGNGTFRTYRRRGHCPFSEAKRKTYARVELSAKAASGRSSFSANRTTSFFLVTGFGSGAYSAKLLNGTKQRFSGLSQARQCGEAVLRMLVTGGPPVRGGGGIPQRIVISSRASPALQTTGVG
jgi:hypothetical protein